MSDQCHYCSIRGLSVTRCDAMCSIPESWYVQELKAALAEKDAMKNLREKLIAEQGAEIAKLRQEVERLQALLLFILVESEDCKLCHEAARRGLNYDQRTEK